MTREYIVQNLYAIRYHYVARAMLNAEIPSAA